LKVSRAGVGLLHEEIIGAPAMRLTRALLVIADISGYTRFITQREVSLTHAEQIITELLETVIDGAEFPLKLNKLEGDAALLFAETGDDPARAAADVLRQVQAAFALFDTKLAAISAQRRHCSCEACGNIGNLRLKAFLHEGEIAIKRVRQFEELAGENVILIHRLLKNSVSRREYLLLTRRFADLLGAAQPAGEDHREDAEGVGMVELRIVAPEARLALAGTPG
jgi:hypothetical protein